MKLKGKLITGFTTVVVITLGIFGIITYYTFADTAGHKSAKIIKLQSHLMILEAHSTLHHKIIELVTSLAPNIKQLLDHRIPEDKVMKLLHNLVAKEPLINSIYLYNYPHKDLIPLSAVHTEPALLPQLETIPPEKNGLWFIADHKLYLIFLIPELDNNSSVIVQINQGALRAFLTSLFTINRSTIYISRNNELLIPPVYLHHGAHPQTPNFNSIKNLINSTQKEIEIGDSTKAFRPSTKLFGTDVTFLIPNEFYNSYIISLKNRIITAMLIVGWCSIWAILILAHTIANPIRKLTQLTKDIIAFNYSTELEIKPSKDEIGELAINFETMRLKIKDLVTKDQLTDVYTRHFLMHIFELAVLKGLRLGEELSCIMIDIDNFKKINDAYGHQAGDEVLAEMGKVLLDHTRNYDTPARYGGEEFILVLPDTDIKTAKEIAERIRKTMAKRLISFEKQAIACTLSLGVAGLDKYTASTVEEIINHADTALYEAKNGGRNRTVVYEEDKPDKREEK